MSNIDWDDVDNQTQGGSYPEGDYEVVINSWEPVTAKTGTKQIRWHGVIINGPAGINQKITEHTPLTEKSFWRIGKLMKACGINIKGLGKMGLDSPKFSKILNLTRNRRSIWIVGKDEKDTSKRNKIVDYAPVNDQESIDATDLIGAADVPAFLKE